MKKEGAVRDESPQLHVLAPTWFEYAIARLRISRAPVIHSGIGLKALQRVTGSRVIVCGLAGSLSPELRSGDLFVPESVELEDGSKFECEPTLVHSLLEGGRRLGMSPVTGKLLTASAIIGADTARAGLGDGPIGVDMETGRLAAKGVAVATARVILDTPGRPISESWTEWTRAALNPNLWREMLWLAHSAPRYAVLAATVVEETLKHVQSGPAGSTA